MGSKMKKFAAEVAKDPEISNGITMHHEEGEGQIPFSALQFCEDPDVNSGVVLELVSIIQSWMPPLECDDEEMLNEWNRVRRKLKQIFESAEIEFDKLLKIARIKQKHR